MIRFGIDSIVAWSLYDIAVHSMGAMSTAATLGAIACGGDAIMQLFRVLDR